MVEWKEVKLSDVAEIVGGATPSTKDDENYTGGNIAWITPKDLSNFTGRYISEGERCITEKGYNSCSTQMLPKHSVLFSSRAPIGYVAISDRELCTNQGFKSAIPGPNIDYLFLYYLLKFKKDAIESMGSGTTFKEVSGNVMKNVLIEIPVDIDIQKKIACILDKIDSKIENNNSINRNLQEQMQTIFSSIFYPEIEKGNKVSLGDYLYIKGRIGWKGLKKEEYLDDSEYRIINGESLTTTGIDWKKAGYISEERYTESPEIMLQVGDILISKDGTIGKIGYVDKLEKPTSVASGIFVVRNLKPEEVSTVFIYCLLNSDYFRKFIASRTEGSVIPHLYQKDFVTLEVPLLSGKQLEYFNNSVVPLFDLYFANQTENLRLVELRDALLPKLMSGELDVSDLDI